jgi:hypothetical protein
MNRVIKTLPLDLIKLDQENVRFGGDVAENQKEALQLLMDDPADAKKLYNLAQHISINGMDPTELQLVFPDQEGHHIVIEGNRRLAALKLLIKPDLCPVESRVKDFITLKDGAKYQIPNQLEFGCVESREAGDKWIELKHTGENNGVGRVNWDSDIRDERKARASGVESIGRQLRKLITANPSLFSSITQAHCKKVSVTNLTRLFQSTPAQIFFLLEVKSRVLTPKYDLKYIAPSVTYALELMAEKKFTVDNIRHNKDRTEFIHTIPADLSPISLIQATAPASNTQSANSTHTTGLGEKESETFHENKSEILQYPDSDAIEESTAKDEGSGEEINGESGSKRPRAKPDRRQRNRLIDWPMQIEPARINDLFRDLRTKLNVLETPSSVAVVFRVFLEVSCDYYVKTQHEAGNPVFTADQKRQPVFSNNQIKLAMKVQAVSRHLEERTKLTRDEAKAIRKRADAPDSMGSIDHLNQFVHGYSAMAIPADLNTIADEYKPLLEKIWG